VQKGKLARIVSDKRVKLPQNVLARVRSVFSKNLLLRMIFNDRVEENYWANVRTWRQLAMMEPDAWAENEYEIQIVERVKNICGSGTKEVVIGMEGRQGGLEPPRGGIARGSIFGYDIYGGMKEFEVSPDRYDSQERKRQKQANEEEYDSRKPFIVNPYNLPPQPRNDQVEDGWYQRTVMNTSSAKKKNLASSTYSQDPITLQRSTSKQKMYLSPKKEQPTSRTSTEKKQNPQIKVISAEDNNSKKRAPGASNSSEIYELVEEGNLLASSSNHHRPQSFTLHQSGTSYPNKQNNLGGNIDVEEFNSEFGDSEISETGTLRSNREGRAARARARRIQQNNRSVRVEDDNFSIENDKIRPRAVTNDLSAPPSPEPPAKSPAVVQMPVPSRLQHSLPKVKEVAEEQLESSPQLPPNKVQKKQEEFSLKGVPTSEKDDDSVPATSRPKYTVQPDSTSREQKVVPETTRMALQSPDQGRIEPKLNKISQEQPQTNPPSQISTFEQQKDSTRPLQDPPTFNHQVPQPQNTQALSNTQNPPQEKTEDFSQYAPLPKRIPEENVASRRTYREVDVRIVNTQAPMPKRPPREVFRDFDYVDSTSSPLRNQPMMTAERRPETFDWRPYDNRAPQDLYSYAPAGRYTTDVAPSRSTAQRSPPKQTLNAGTSTRAEGATTYRQVSPSSYSPSRSERSPQQHHDQDFTYRPLQQRIVPMQTMGTSTTINQPPGQYLTSNDAFIRSGASFGAGPQDQSFTYRQRSPPKQGHSIGTTTHTNLASEATVPKYRELTRVEPEDNSSSRRYPVSTAKLTPGKNQAATTETVNLSRGSIKAKKNLINSQQNTFTAEPHSLQPASTFKPPQFESVSQPAAQASTMQPSFRQQEPQASPQNPTYTTRMERSPADPAYTATNGQGERSPFLQDDTVIFPPVSEGYVQGYSSNPAFHPSYMESRPEEDNPTITSVPFAPHTAENTTPWLSSMDQSSPQP
jgi:hypothetical protein